MAAFWKGTQRESPGCWHTRSEKSEKGARKRNKRQKEKQVLFGRQSLRNGHIRFRHFVQGFRDPKVTGRPAGRGSRRGGRGSGGARRRRPGLSRCAGRRPLSPRPEARSGHNAAGAAASLRHFVTGGSSPVLPSLGAPDCRTRGADGCPQARLQEGLPAPRRPQASPLASPSSPASRAAILWGGGDRAAAEAGQAAPGLSAEGRGPGGKMAAALTFVELGHGGGRVLEEVP